MSLYENMKKLDQISNRLKSASETEEDRQFISDCLSRLCDGDDAYEVFNITSSSGVSRSDYRSKRFKEDIVKMIAAHLDSLAIGMSKEGNPMLVDEERNRGYIKAGILRVAIHKGMKFKEVEDIWYDEDYSQYRNPFID
jgi:hypothetical protein